jgi:GAF domain-containing protein
VPVTTRSEAAIAAVTSALTRSNDPASVLATIVTYAVSCLGLVGAAIVAKSADGELHPLCSAPSDHSTGVWADLYVSAPVAEGVRQGTVVVVDGILDDGHRWYGMRELLGSVGVRGMRVFPVRVHGAPFGALVAYSAEPWGQQRPSGTGQTLADLAALVLSQGPADHRQPMAVEQIVGLLESQVATNRAYGMLAEAGHMTIDAATSVLVDYARFYRVTQAEVAGWLIADATRIPTVLGDPATSGPAAPAFGESGG